MRRLFSGIRPKLIVILVLIGVLPVLVSGWSTIWQSRRALIQVEANRLHTLGTDNARVIEEWLLARLEEVKWIASLPEAQQLDRSIFWPLLDFARSATDYASIYLVSPNGTGAVGIDFSFGDGRLVFPATSYVVSDQAWFRRAIAGEEAFSQPTLQPVVMSNEERYQIQVAAPIRKGNEIIGVVAAAVWLNTIFEQVRQVDIGEMADVYLIASNGMPLSSASSIRDMTRPLTTRAAQAIQRGESGISTYENPAGVTVMGSYTYIPHLGWGLLVELEETRAVAAAQQLGQHLSRALVASVLITVAAVVLVGFIAANTITRPVLAFATATRAIAQGNLAPPVLPTNRTDELGEMAKDFSQMVETLRQTVGELIHSASELSDSSQQLEHVAEQSYRTTKQIAETINQVAIGASRQSASIQQTVDSVAMWRRSVDQIASGAYEQSRQVQQTHDVVRQMTGTLESVAHSAERVANASERAVTSARQGGNSVGAVVAGMEEIQASVSQAAARVGELERRSREIGEIVDIIKEIAENTNLLALNAAIEAARAGEHGRGFAVVAQEVRKLAEHSARSAEQITNLIGSMQQSIASATEATETGLAQVQNGTALAASAGEALQQIIRVVEESFSLSQEIARVAAETSAQSAKLVEHVDKVSAVTQQNTVAAEEMAQSSDQVAQAIETIASVSEETAAAAEEVTASAEEGSAFAERVKESANMLAETARALERLVKRFTL